MTKRFLCFIGGFLLGAAAIIGRWFYLIYLQSETFQQGCAEYLRSRGWKVNDTRSKGISR